MTTCTLEDYGIEDSPKIDYIRHECAALFAHSEITHFGCLNLIKCLRHIGIEWRQQTRHMACTSFLQLLAIQREIVLRNRAHSHQFHIALNQIEQHWQLIHPTFAHPSSQGSHTYIVVEFTAFLQRITVIDLCL